MDASWDQNLGLLHYSGARFRKSAENAASNGSRCSGQAPPILPGAGAGQGQPLALICSATGLTAKTYYSRKLGVPLIIHFIKTSRCICYELYSTTRDEESNAVRFHLLCSCHCHLQDDQQQVRATFLGFFTSFDC
jgi:hypothetical protein